MTDQELRCAEFEAHLPDFLDGGLDAGTREACERHRLRCTACAAVVADLDALVTAAGSLPLPAPSRDLWPAIEARLATPVRALDDARPRAATRPTLVWRRLAAAAALLVTASAGITWQVARRTTSSTPAVTVASEGMTPAPTTAPSASADGVPLTFTNTTTRAVALDTLYGREIALLQTVVQDNLGLLDSSTVQIVQRNLDIIDQAIRESREALAADPNSGFLFEQLDRAYERKVDLLRRLATL
jgi:anti-sigma factor RsiW